MRRKTKDVGAELLTPRETGTLEERPPLVVQPNLASQPVGDGLLRDGRVSDRAQLRGERLLAPAGELDRTDKSLDMRRDVVVHLHTRWAQYTNAFVSSTSGFVGAKDKGVCRVLDMASAALKKPSKPPKAPKAPKAQKERRALPGPDGKTLGQRVAEAMAFKSGRLGREYRPVDLLEDVNRLAHASPTDPFLSQQMLSAILTNKVSSSAKAPFIAIACGVSVTWLIQGIGKITDSGS